MFEHLATSKRIRAAKAKTDRVVYNRRQRDDPVIADDFK